MILFSVRFTLISDFLRNIFVICINYHFDRLLPLLFILLSINKKSRYFFYLSTVLKVVSLLRGRH